MPVDLIILSVIIAGMAVLFITERLSADLVAFTGLLLMILFGYLTPAEAFSGFSSSVVLTIIPMFMLGAGLRLTGVTDLLANLVINYFGKSEFSCVLVVMLLGTFTSSFMNNVAAAALLLPAVVSIAQKTSNSPSRLLIPLTFSILLGGTTTLIGTAPNIVASQILTSQSGLKLSFFDFTYYGLILSFLGILYMLFIGRHLLPNNVKLLKKGSINLTALYHLKEHVFALRVPKGAGLNGQSLASLHFGESLGVNVVSIVHAGDKIFNPGPESKVFAGDTLIVNGVKSDLLELTRFKKLKVLDFDYKELSSFLGKKALKIKDNLSGRTISDMNLLATYHILVVAIERDGGFIFKKLSTEKLKTDDVLHVLLSDDCDIEKISQEFSVLNLSELDYKITYKTLSENLKVIDIPGGSLLAGLTLKESRMQELTGLVVAAIKRQEDFITVSDSSLKLEEGDKLIVIGDPSKIDYLSKLGELELLSSEDASRMLESDEVGLMEVILAPRSLLISKTVSELSFREKYDMNVIALWREGSAILNNLSNTPFKFGDALLLHGLKSKMPVFARDSDFVALTDTSHAGLRKSKAFFAILSIFILILISASGLFSLEFAAWLSVIILVLSGSISMDDGYREVDWRVVILVAALLPLSIVFEKMQLAHGLSIFFSDNLSSASPYVILFIIGLLCSLVSQLLEGALAVIFFVPFILSVAEKYSMDPKLAVLFIAVSASNAFLTPFSHRAHLLVMGAGAYKWKDYLRAGFPLTILMQTALFILIAFSI